MTRINCIPVSRLDKIASKRQIQAEYREITRIPAYMKKSNYQAEIPEQYILGKGHVKFFYNKGRYLQKRTEELFYKCKSLGINVKYKKYKLSAHPRKWRQDWKPDKKAIKINKARIKLRLTKT